MNEELKEAKLGRSKNQRKLLTQFLIQHSTFLIERRIFIFDVE